MPLKRRSRDESGAAAVLFAVLSVVLLGIAALGTDIGNMVSRRTETQASADFAAFAAAQELNKTAKAGETPSTDVVTAVRDYLNHNQAQDDELACAQTEPGTCVTSAELTDLDLTNGEVRYVAAGLQVVAPKTRVDFGMASIFGNHGAYVDAAATINVFSGGQRVMPMFAVSACDYGRQTLTDPAGGHVTPVVPTLAHATDTNTTDLASATLTNSSGTTVTELPRDSTGNSISLTASKWEKTQVDRLLPRATTPTRRLVVRQDYFWSPPATTPTAPTPTPLRGPTSPRTARLRRTSPTGTPTIPRRRSRR